VPMRVRMGLARRVVRTVRVLVVLVVEVKVVVLERLVRVGVRVPQEITWSAMRQPEGSRRSSNVCSRRTSAAEPARPGLRPRIVHRTYARSPLTAMSPIPISRFSRD